MDTAKVNYLIDGMTICSEGKKEVKQLVEIIFNVSLKPPLTIPEVGQLWHHKNQESLYVRISNQNGELLLPFLKDCPPSFYSMSLGMSPSHTGPSGLHDKNAVEVIGNLNDILREYFQMKGVSLTE